jgi:hypothetical protein
VMLALALCLLALPCGPQERRAVPVQPPAAPLPASDLRLALYDVAALTGHAELARTAQALARAVAPDAGRAHLDFQELERLRTQSEMQRDGLLAALREGLQPPLGDDGRLEWLEGGRVALLGTPVQQGWVAGFLANAQSVDGLFDVQTVFWSVPRSAGRSDLLARHGERLSATAVQELLSLLDAPGIERTSAPRMLCFPFAAAEIRVGIELAYVADWEFLELADRSEPVPAPVVERAFDGLSLALRCIPLEGGRVRLDADGSLTTLQRPIPELSTTFGRLPAPVTVQLPEWTTVRVTGHVDLAAGETLLLAAEDATADRVVLALVGATSVPALESR